MSVEESTETKKRAWIRLTGSINWLSFIAGLTFMASLAAGGEFITRQAASSSLIKNYGALFASLFIGSSTGHYYGRAIEAEEKAVHSAYLGAFTLLFSYWILQNRGSLLTATLVLMTSSLVLAHHSGLVVKSNFIKKAIDYFAAGLSPLGILLFGAMKYVAPALPLSGVLQTIVDSLTQKVTFLNAEVNIVIFVIGALVGASILLAVFAEALSSENES